jgi:hypothetical protein
MLTVGAAADQHQAEPLARARLLRERCLELVRRNRAARDQHLTERPRRT